MEDKKKEGGGGGGGLKGGDGKGGRVEVGELCGRGRGCF